MEICHPHNLTRPLDVPRPYGIRVKLRPSDTFTRLLGNNWEREHWYATRAERDKALADMASEHLYSRIGDRPTPLLEPIERKA
jgi:hypothetical protein